MKNQYIKVIEEDFSRGDETNLTCLTVKCPWYDNSDNIIGVFGCSIALGQQPLMNSLSQISRLNLVTQSGLTANNQHTTGRELNNVYLSSREIEVLSHLIKGKSAREIGIILNLSRRTIEHRLENIKLKLGVESKSELIAAVIDSFWYQ